MLVCAPLVCQDVSVLAGGVYARYADSISGTAALTTLRFSGSNSHMAGNITGSLSRFASGEYVTQITGFGTVVFPAGGGLSLGVSAGGDANRIEGGTWSGQASAGLVGALSGNGTLVTAGASLGTLTTVYDSTVTTKALSAFVGQTVTRGMVLSAGVAAMLSDSVRYVDATMELAFTGAKTRASVSGGLRTGDLSDDPWGQGHIEYDVLPRLTYSLTLGRYPRSLVGFTDGLYLTSGIRIRLSGRGSSPSAPEPPVEVVTLETNQVRITFEYEDDAEILEIAGEWNGWLPVQLNRGANGTWSGILDLEPGIYKYAIVVNGDTWTVPDGVPSEPDDFGGAVATLVVTGGRAERR